MRRTPAKARFSPTWDLVEPSTRWVGRTFGPYRIRKLIHSDERSVSWLADDRSAARLRRVLIKTPAQADRLDDFEREAEVALHLRHSQLVQGLARIDLEGRPALVYEWVDGLRWAEALELGRKRNEAFPVPAAVTLALRALDGLGHAHRTTGSNGAPIVHGGVHPGVLWITRDGDLRVSGFGDRGTHSRVQVRFAYLAPEQVNDGHPEPRSDVFALAVCLVEAVSGVHPFVRKDARSTLQAISLSDRRPVADLLPHRWPELEAVLETALASRPTDRFESAASFAHALQRALAKAGHRPTSKGVLAWLKAWSRGQPYAAADRAGQPQSASTPPGTGGGQRWAPTPPAAVALPTPSLSEAARGARPLTAERFDLKAARRLPPAPKPSPELDRLLEGALASGDAADTEGSGSAPALVTDDLLALASRAQGWRDVPPPASPPGSPGPEPARKPRSSWWPWRRRSG